jgi:transposase InsO family protein
MSWKISDAVRARQQFVTERLALKRGDSMAGLCARHGISRECGYKWWRRFKAEGRLGLLAQARVAHSAQRLQTRWWERLRMARRQCQDFGPKKLRWELHRTYPHERPPALRTLARWLERLGLVRRRKRRAPLGPKVSLPGRLVGRRVNDVWTVDLKGSFCTRDRLRINALTVRDLASRCILCVRHVGRGGEREIGAAMDSLFRHYGLPRALRMDNGGPFGALGPRGWSRLSVRWIKLGLRLEYGRPGCPQDNAEHEQMHRILKQRTACPASRNLRAQQRRFARWCRWYNYRRPHESIGMRVPASRYQRSPRVWPKPASVWIYPAHWERLQPDAKGRCRWRNVQRLIGRAFAHEALGGKPLHNDVLAIYLGPHLLGTLHASDRAGLRPVVWRAPN